MIDTATKAVVVVTGDCFAWFRRIWMTLWCHGLARDTQRVNFATNSFHVL
jgi:hypothetical protein